MIPNQFGDNDSKTSTTEESPGRSALVSWVVNRIKHARDVRDAEYGESWREYTRIWRGIYSSSDKTTDSERSRLISPATAQAVERPDALDLRQRVMNRERQHDGGSEVGPQRRVGVQGAERGDCDRERGE